MTEQFKTPIYNLSAALRETGLKADVLRAWERRYELPKPQRTEGGQRIYSSFDIEVIKWLVKKQKEGLSISHAVDLWRSILATGDDPLIDKTRVGTADVALIEPEFPTTLDHLKNGWINACITFNSIQAEEVLNLAFSLHPVETVCTEILQSGLREIGNGWYEGKISIQQEHFSSLLANRRLQMLISMTPLPNRPQTVLIGCPAGELHMLPVLEMELFLRRRGLKVINLGADIPIDQMVSTVLQLQPDLIILAAQTLHTAANLKEAFLALQESGRQLAYGGLIFNRIPALREHILASFLGEDISASITIVEGLLTNTQVRPSFSMVENPYRQLAQFFMEQHTAINQQIVENMSDNGLPIEIINKANLYFGNEVGASLRLVNPEYIEVDLEWIRLLLSGRSISPDRLKSYLKAYRNAVDQVLGETGVPITRLLDAIISTRPLLHK